VTASYTQALRYLSVSTPAGADVLLLRACRGEEGLSTPFQFSLDMVSENAALDFSTIVGQGATVTMEASGGATRYVHGIMTRFVQAGTVNGFTTYHGELRPWFWLLRMTSDNCVYQQQSTLDIVKAVFDGLGFSDYRDATTGTYAPRDYAVQYGETAFDFVSRLLEEDGIHYFFEHADGKHTLVLADDSDAHTACAGPTAIRYLTGADAERGKDDMILDCIVEQQVISNAYSLDDYEFTTPATDLTVSVTGDSGPLKLYDYPGRYSKTDAGNTLANVRLQAVEADAKCLSGSSTVRTFTPGFTFSLTDHNRNDANTTYLLRHVVHDATLEEYTNAFEAIPSTVTYRPRRLTPSPRIAGAQTAVVVGKSGEEIWTDQYGRVKVQFHWDQKGKNDENSSCWLRVAQGWAGKSWGMVFLPRIGQEVLVTFLDGDPDRPIVTGSVYNATQVVPYALPGEQTKSTIMTNSSKGGGGSNEVRFEDKAGSEELYLHAQKDMTTLVEHDRTETIKNNDTLTVTQAKSVTVTDGDDSYTISKGKRTLAVTAGDETHTVGGKRSLTVTGDETHTNSAKFTHTVTGDYTLTVSGNLTIEAKGSVSIKSGTTFATESGTTMSQKADSDLSLEATGTLSTKGATVNNEATGELTNKGATVTNNASAQLNNKSGGLQNVEASGVLVVKGSLVKIN
jgi:type VI secretion system secreted protein VgrG